MEFGEWPQLVVVGAPVTPDQAAEIILRTSGFLFVCNDEAWTATVELELGITEDPARNATLRGELGILELGRLWNWRVATDAVWGPYGWVDWQGVVGCSGYNIAASTRAELMRDWTLIARAWPFLELRCQVCPAREIGDGFAPALEFAVAEGEVSVVKPSEDLRYSAPSGITWRPEQIAARIARVENDRGCTVEQLRRAAVLARTRRLHIAPFTPKPRDHS